MTNEDKELTNNSTTGQRDPTTSTPVGDIPDCPLCREHAPLEPNAKTLAAMRELEEGRGTKLFGTVKELFAELDAEGDEEESQ
jgi:hypothetical protein